MWPWPDADMQFAVAVSAYMVEIISHIYINHTPRGKITQQDRSHPLPYHTCTCVNCRAAVSVPVRAEVSFYLTDNTKVHQHCDTLAGSVIQTECHADTMALTSQFRLCQQLFDSGRLDGKSRSCWNAAAVEAVERKIRPRSVRAALHLQPERAGKKHGDREESERGGRNCI